MFRKPVFWVAFAVVSLLGTTLAVHLFPRAMPLVTLNLTMDRATALSRASELAARHHWGPKDYRQAAAFGADDTVQAYVELEAGGNEAFVRLLSEDLYSFYTWQVRLFKEQETNETLVLFTPEGEAYGFRERLPEDAPGAELDAEDARPIAEAAATDEWAIDLGAFSPLEESQEIRPGGRVDHTFVYERAGEDGRLAEARYRLRLVVSGDRFTELTHFVKIPEAFERRFAEMRSRNDLVAGVSNLVVSILYGGGAIFGLFLLLRRRFVVWRPAVPWAAAVGVLFAAATLSQWPLAWMGYDTAVSATSFAAQQIVYAILNGLFIGVVAMVAFVAGESLTRQAFPAHGQLWRLWSPDGARSREVLGGTVGAYLLIGPLLGYLALLYALAREHLGWWMPSSALTDPNVVAGYAPWLFPVALSLQAGFIEEVVFRAVPLAGAVLLGRRFGGQRYWVGAALLLQAVLFGAVHANYPAQPAYARLVEIAIPFLFIGVIYMVFGLLPAIVMHFAFDVFMFSLPLFASSAQGIWIDRTLVVVLALIPLWVVLGARLRRGGWIDLPAQLRNAAWSPAPQEDAPAEEPRAEPASALGRRAAGGLVAAGVLGLAAWVAFTPFRADAPSLAVTKATALDAARSTLEGQGATLDGTWKELASVGGDVGAADRFVWQEGGPDTYRAVVGTHIEAPHWRVRYARFEGDVAERAEERVVHVGPDGKAVRVRHRLPEDRPGESLTLEEARKRAAAAIRSTLDLDVASLREVSAEPSERPARRDWALVFEDPAVKVGGKGEARLAVSIAGDEVVDVFRHVHVPEEWQRSEQKRFALTSLVSNLCGFPMGAGLLAGAAAGLVAWSRGRFARRTFGVAFVGLFVVFAFRALNAWPSISAGFDTSQPWASQAAMALAGSMVGAAFQAVFLALIFGFAHRWLPAGAGTPRTAILVRGVALGAAWAGLSAVAGATATSTGPVWGSLGSAASAVPWVATALESVGAWAMRTAPLLLLFGLAASVSRSWTRRRGATAALLVATGLLLSGVGGIETIPRWLASGLGTGVVLWLSYWLVLRFQPALIPLATAGVTILSLIRQGILAPYPGASFAAVLGAVCVGILGVWWAGRLERDSATGPETATQ